MGNATPGSLQRRCSGLLFAGWLRHCIGPSIPSAAALPSLLQGSTPFLLTAKPGTPSEDSPADPVHDESESRIPAPQAVPRQRVRRSPRSSKGGVRFETFRIEIGHVHGVQPGNIVGTIANEAGLDGRDIGHIDIREEHSFVDLPAGMPKEIFDHLQAVQVRGTDLRIRRTHPRAAHSERPQMGLYGGGFAAGRASAARIIDTRKAWVPQRRATLLDTSSKRAHRAAGSMLLLG